VVVLGAEEPVLELSLAPEMTLLQIHLAALLGEVVAGLFREIAGRREHKSVKLLIRAEHGVVQVLDQRLRPNGPLTLALDEPEPVIHALVEGRWLLDRFAFFR
jgi:hypothetical protein